MRMAIQVLRQMKEKGEDTDDTSLVLTKIKAAWPKSKWVKDSNKDNYQRISNARYALKKMSEPVVLKRQEPAPKVKVVPAKKPGRPRKLQPANGNAVDKRVVEIDDIVKIKTLMNRMGHQKLQELVKVFA